MVLLPSTSQSWVCNLFSKIHSGKDPQRRRSRFHTADSYCQYQQPLKVANLRGILPRLGEQHYSCISFPSRQSFCSSAFDVSQKGTGRRLLNDVIEKIDADRLAVVELIPENEQGRGGVGRVTTTYGELRCTSRIVAELLLKMMEEDGASAKRGMADLRNHRVAYMIPPGSTHVAVKLGIWLAGGVVVPLCPSHPLPEIEYLLSDAKPFALVSSRLYIYSSPPLLYSSVTIPNILNLFSGTGRSIPYVVLIYALCMYPVCYPL